MKKETTTAIPNGIRQSLCLLATALLLSANASAADCTEGGHNIDITKSDYSDTCVYGIKPGTTLNQTIGLIGTGSTVVWNRILGSNCIGAPNGINCSGLTVVIPGYPGTEVLPSATVTLSGTAPGTEGNYNFGLHVEDAASGGPPATDRNYSFRVANNGGGWGDPHITTVDGVAYDFQGAGEFVALEGDGMEVQTRQTPVATSSIPNANGYTGLKSCVSIYTAVAARVGAHRVTIQPNINGVPDPSGLQIRVDGNLKTLGPDGIDLSTCNGASGEPQQSGRIVRSADDESIEIHYADGTKVVVTPDWWGGQQKWYLNVNVYNAIASEGIMGHTVDNWLPAKSDGTSVGAKASNLHDRYVQLNETFANSWRVTDTDSLFDYAPGTSTATFTKSDWPRENPTSCLIQNEPTAEPVDEAVAEEACSEVTDANNRANCIFDVRVTGYTGFAGTYVTTEQLAPGATQTLLVADKDESKPGTKITFSVSVTRAALRLAKVTSGNVQFILDGKNAGQPMALNADGKAVWSISNLTVGKHQVAAKYSGTTGFGEQYLANTSNAVNHTVTMPPDDGIPLWRIILILIILIAMIIWWLSGRKAAKTVNTHL